LNLENKLDLAENKFGAKQVCDTSENIKKKSNFIELKYNTYFKNEEIDPTLENDYSILLNETQ